VPTVLKEGGGSLSTLANSIGGHCHDGETMKFGLKEDHLKLLFEVRGEVADLKFKVEQLDQNITMLLALCSRRLYQQSTHI
jgi:hypothetical protein